MLLVLVGGVILKALDTIAWKATRPATKMSTPMFRITTPRVALTAPPTTCSRGLR